MFTTSQLARARFFVFKYKNRSHTRTSRFVFTCFFVFFCVERELVRERVREEERRLERVWVWD